MFIIYAMALLFNYMIGVEVDEFQI